MLDQPEGSADGAAASLLRRIRAAVAVSALVAAGLSLGILVEEPRLSGVALGAAAVAGVHALVLGALRGPSPSAGLRAAQAIAGPAALLSALVSLPLLSRVMWLDAAACAILVHCVLQLLVMLWSRRALAARSEGDSRGAVSTVLRGLAAVVALLVLITIIVPSKVHPPRYETSAIGELRSMVSAQSAYSAANGGFYDVPECLLTPHRCIPGYAPNAPTFVDAFLGQTTAIRSGYRLVFHPGAPADPAAIRRAGASASSLTSFVYVAVPLDREYSATTRAFCTDATGVICYTPDGRAPATEGGTCSPCQYTD